MISHELILDLLRRTQTGFPVTSLYLDLSSSKFTTRDAEILLKGMIKNKKQVIEERSLNKEQKRSVGRDFEKLTTYSATQLDRKGSKGIAIFSSSGLGFWEVLPLPGPVRSVLIVDKDPYIRPLTMLLDEYKRYCTVLVDRGRARVFAVSLGEIEDHSQILDEVPGQVKASGWGGYDERRIERHIEDHVRRHLRNTADVTYDFFRQKKFDRLIIGGQGDIVREFEDHLHSYLRERIVARVNVEPSVSLDEALRKTMEVDRETEERSDREMVQQLLENARSRGLGVLGLRGVLGALRRNQVHTLFIEMGYVEKGVVCDECGFIGTEEQTCPLCRGNTRHVLDVVEEAIRETLRQNGAIVHVNPESGLAGEGHIGATLRFKL